MRFILAIIITTLVHLPVQNVLASAGSVDQYGGHLADGMYHYHELAIKPAHYSGSMMKPEATLTFFMPKIVSAKLLKTPSTLEDSVLIENAALDVSYCQHHGIFAQGKYDIKGNVRVAPVCVDEQSIVETQIALGAGDSYRELPTAVGGDIQKVYNFRKDSEGRVIFTNKPELNELVGKIVMGHTDSKMYTVIGNDLDMGLREINEGYAKLLAGSEDYKKHVTYFDDSVVYGYKIGSSL